MSVPRRRLRNLGFTPLSYIYVKVFGSKRFRKHEYTPQLGRSLEQSDDMLEIKIPTKEGADFFYRMDPAFRIYEVLEARFLGRRVPLFRDSPNNLLKMPYGTKSSQT
jgi:hypothetical protein